MPLQESASKKAFGSNGAAVNQGGGAMAQAQPGPPQQTFTASRTLSGMKG